LSVAGGTFFRHDRHSVGIFHYPPMKQNPADKIHASVISNYKEKPQVILAGIMVLSAYDSEHILEIIIIGIISSSYKESIFLCLYGVYACYIFSTCALYQHINLFKQ